ncbi:mannonate dehydratase [Falsirhodobacter sp. alg1]|uniref:mannonate dehydratase n=1 Tax=Falsirhodobacter sp. alg1 TaxID=1472418 RepID=UPI0005EFA963|nr:mannonate dehydratase [Falsirhodobacter sp. alg1]
MRQTWRWFGPTDLVSTSDMRQAGVQGVVSALHHVPAGAVWTPQDIVDRRNLITQRADGPSSGLTWDVVESLPVSEDIKKQQGNWRDHIANWKTSLHNLRDAGLEVVCYNFMPVLDWTRTDLSWPRPSGATCMRFDFTDFAAFDIHILKRDGATEDFPDDIVELAAERFAEMSDAQRAKLSGNVVFGLPGAAGTLTLDDVRHHLAEYDPIREDQLRSNLVDFLSEVAPLAERLGMRLCCHPDDPPFPLLGLPRIMSTEADYARVMQAVDVPANGITLCTGSLGARADNDPVGMMRRLGDRVHFLHLRNVTLDTPEVPRGSFYEDEHLSGQTDMVAMIAAILAEEHRRRSRGRLDCHIPFRPDHGQDILEDQNRKVQPGYPAIGRLKGLAELRGIMTALEHPAVTVSSR